MSWKLPAAGLTALTLALSACGGSDSGNEANTAQPGAAEEAAGEETIAAGLDQNSRFVQALKATGRPYRILPPDAMATMDYSADRINVHTDANGIVLDVRCG